MLRIHAAALGFAALFACGAAFAQVQRTFVASTGNDANTATNCGFANPCRSFTAAQTVTQSGGEIIALDAAGYGAITITKSISILANPGAYAGISASAGSAVTIATADVHVRLSGLRINGIGASYGIQMTNGATLTVDDCTVSGFMVHGIWINANARARILNSLVMNNIVDGILMEGGADGTVVNTTALGNDRVGIFVDGNTATTTSLVATRSVASQNSYGFVSRANVPSAISKLTVVSSTADHNGEGFYALLNAGTSSTLNVAGSTASRNSVGFEQFGTGAVFNSAGNNLVIDNGTNTFGTITNVGTM